MSLGALGIGANSLGATGLKHPLKKINEFSVPTSHMATSAPEKESGGNP